MGTARPVMKRLVSWGIGLLLALLLPVVALASLSQGFAATSAIPSGSLVSLDAKSTGTVVSANATNATRLFGVAVPPSSASISLGGADSTGQVQVATSGTATVFVSTASGAIKVGDYVSVSPISGVGQKAVGNVRVIGIAQTDFDGKAEGLTKTTIDVGGAKTEVTVGQIPVQIAVSTYNQDSLQTYLVPGWLQSLSNTLAGKTVSPIRIIIAGLILLVAITSTTVLLYSAVRNSIISIGRNPLSRSSVYKGLFQICVIVALILVLAAGGMYLVISK